MAKHTPENLRKLLDYLTARPKLKPAMRAIGCDEGLIFTWMQKSAQGDPRFLVDWPEGEEPLQFVEQIKRARQRNIIMLDAAFRDEVQNGIERVVVSNGVVCYAVDPQLAADALSPARWAMLHGDRPITDVYARDTEGKLIALTVIEPATAQIKIKAVTALIPGVYGDHTSVNVNVRHGPLILQRPGEQTTAPKMIEHQPEQVLFEPEKPEHEAPRMVVGRKATSSDEMDQWQADGEFEHQPVEIVKADGTTEHAVAGPRVPSLEELMPLSKGKPLSPLQEELLALSRKKPENPHPTSIVEKFSADDTEVHDAERVRAQAQAPRRAPPPGASSGLAAGQNPAPTRADQAGIGRGVLAGGMKMV